MKLSIVFPVLNQNNLALNAIQYAIKNLSGERDVEVIILDNASEVPFNPYGRTQALVPIQNPTRIIAEHEETTGNVPDRKVVTVKTVRLSKNIGVYPTFWEALKFATGDIVAFFHSDLIISEQGWDTSLLAQFERNEKLGLVGFIGSDEIDSSGGRGRGTTSNFQGNTTKSCDKGICTEWTGSPARAHGQTNPGFTKAAVVDGCAMIFRREVLEKVPERLNFPPHHFYDRLLSSETREAGYEMGVLGIGCDHISGQTVNQEPAYNEMAQKWAEAHGLTMEGVHNWDSVLYREAEKQWLTEYRDTKHLVPCKV